MELPNGIKPYFTGFVYARVGFVVLEDRKFKTGPLSVPTARRDYGARAQLLGVKKKAFRRLRTSSIVALASLLHRVGDHCNSTMYFHGTDWQYMMHVFRVIFSVHR